MMKHWYAVQVGDEIDCGYGSTVKREAIKMANAMKRDHDYDGKEIRIVVTYCDDDFCEDEIIIRNGER